MKRLFAFAVTTCLLATSTVLAADGPRAHFMENWDLDENGAVTTEEARERRSDVFASFDANDDGNLDAEEYKAFDEARALDQAENEPGGMGKGRRSPANLMALEYNDTNGDGQVSVDEFLGNSGSWIKQIDKNGDGVVTTADFGRQGKRGQGQGKKRSGD
ncbi:MAG: EF-hand domain-containing protein [Roseibium sp.]